MEHCPQCGVELDSGSPEGLCEGCLFAGGFSLAESTETKLTMGTVRIATGDPQAALEYDSFGPYQILRVLGEGGMGTVYLAEQTHPIQRRVALKVIKPGMDTREILSRFSYERQALALMDHPNIARVYDAGATEKGRPYFVMEYIDGVPITQYCDAHRLNTRERLELFLPVCQALQHAHSKGVIHRDIKPSNVMVIEQDGRAVPKVIDFGIAKATDQRAVENAAFTKLGQFIGTPEYMSPEQADLVSCDIDTSSDVYSLGVLLYELLVGAVPFDSATLRKAGMAELLRIIREDEAPALQSKLTGLGKTVTQVADQRHTDPGSLKRQVAGDLNWIVMKAIEKERRRRYLSVADLAADVHRHLEDQPVLASPPSVVYRARKFVRRNRTAVLAGAVVHVALIAGLAGILWQAQIARQQRAEAVGQRRNAEAQRQRAETQSALALTERGRAEAKAAEAEEQRKEAEGLFNNVRGLAGSMLFKVDDQIAELQGATAAREALVNEATAYLDRLSKDPRSNSEVRRELVAAYLKVADLQYSYGRLNLHDPDGARASYAKAFALLNPLIRGAPSDPDLRHLEIIALLGAAFEEEDGDARDNDYGKALRLAEEQVRLQPKSLQARRDLALAQHDAVARAGVPTAVGVKRLRLAVAIQESVIAEGGPSADDRRLLALYEKALGEYLERYPVTDESLDWYKTSQAILDKLVSEFPSNAQYRQQQAVVMRHMGALMSARNNQGEGLDLIRRSIALYRDLVAGDLRNIGFRVDLAQRESALSFVLNSAGHRDEAVATMQEATGIIEKLVAERPKDLEIRADQADFNDRVSSLWSSAANYKNALRYARIALGQYAGLAREQPLRLRWQRDVANTHRWIGQVLRVNAGSSTAGNDRAAAIEEFRVALTERLKIWNSGQGNSTDLADLANAHWWLGYYLALAGDHAAEMQQYKEAFTLLVRLKSDFPEQKRYTEWAARLYLALAASALQNWKWDEAASYARQALPLVDADYAETPTSANLATLISVLRLSRAAYLHLGDSASAGRLMERMVALSESQALNSTTSTGAALNYVSSLVTLGVDQRDSGNREGALATQQRAEAALDLFEPGKLSVQARSSVASAYERIGSARMQLMDNLGALRADRKALAFRESLYKADPANTSTRGLLRGFYAKIARSFWLTGDLAGARDHFLAALNMPDIGDKAFKLLHAGDYQYSLSLVRSALRETAAAEQDMRKTLDWYRKSEAAGERLWQASQTDLTVLHDIVLAQQGLADVLERMGQQKEALAYRRKALANEVVRSEKTPGQQADLKEALESARATVARLQSNPGQPASLDVARGYRILGALRSEQLDLVPAREALHTALETATALLAQSPRKVEYRLEQMLALQALGMVHLRRADPPAARQSATRARELSLELAKEHALPDYYFTLPGLLAVDIASTEAIAASPMVVSTSRK